jgi:DNA-binding PadR family transcriptional regulator
VQAIEDRSGGAWRPSPGAIYPALQQLQDEGLVKEETPSSGRVFALTDAGKAYVKDHPDEVNAPWESVTESGGEDFFEFMGVVRSLGAAVMQVAAMGDLRQQAAAKKILAAALKDLRRILREDE